jgi:GT2 family glycosyltransferase
MQKLATVIPTFNRKAHLAQVIKDLQAQNVEDLCHDIIVVVDGSTDGTLEMLSEVFPDVHVVNGEGDWWYTRSMNEGFQYAHGLYPDVVLTMNDDVRLPANYLSELLKSYNTQIGRCVMGSLSVTESQPHKVTFSGIKEIKWWRFKYVPHLSHYSRVDLSEMTGVRDSKVLPGRGMLIPAKLLKELRGFDASLIQYGSDDDFCLRAAKQGVDIRVCYDAVVRSYEAMTGVGNPSRGDSLLTVIKGFGNKYSTLYLPKSMQAISRHGNRLMMPLTVLIIILGSIRANFKYRKA